jgi:hypothetical protein
MTANLGRTQGRRSSGPAWSAPPSTTWTSANYLDSSARTIALGRPVQPAQVQAISKLVVLGQEAVSYLWGPATKIGDVLGRVIRLNRTTVSAATK